MSRGVRTTIIAASVASAVAAAVFAVTSLGDGGEGPTPTAAAFAEAWEDGDAEALGELVVDPASLEAFDPLAVMADIDPTATSITVSDIDEEGGSARASFTVRLTLGDIGEVRWEGELPMRDVEGEGWQVDWSPAAMHPEIPRGGTIERITTWPDRAPILGGDGTAVVGDVEVIRVGIEPRRFDRSAIPILAEQLGLTPEAIEEALDAPGVEPDHFVPVDQLRPEDFEAVRDVIFPIPGVTFPRGTDRGGPGDGFARHVVGRFGEVTAERLQELGFPYRVGDRVGLDGLEARFERRLAGLPAIEVRIVDAEHATVEVLAAFAAARPRPVPTTLIPSVQAAAEAALGDVDVPAALVAVDAATGEVRASVSRPRDEAFNRAIGGRYAPGSTFKVITAHALLDHGLDPSSPVECPARLVVDGRPFRNFEGGASGQVPFSTAFSESCNTAIIGAASELPDGALAQAAQRFGFGVDYSLGPTTAGGSFPDPSGAVERAAAAIGQAEVTASPLHMATVAAAVLDGTWRSPVLLPEVEGTPVTRPLDPRVRGELADLMRLVVSEGTGTAAQVPGVDVLGKSGTAEFGSGDPPPTHAWFIAAANGLGMAVVLEDGGVGGRDAGPRIARFLEAWAAG